MTLPVALLPESEPPRVLVGVLFAERHETVIIPLQIHVPQLDDIGSYHLVRVNEQNPPYINWKQYIQKKDFVSPNQPLLLRLGVQPRRPLVRQKPEVEVVLLGQEGNGLSKLRRQEIVNEPKLQRGLCVRPYRKNHHAQQLLVKMPRSDAKNVDRFADAGGCRCLLASSPELGSQVGQHSAPGALLWHILAVRSRGRAEQVLRTATRTGLDSDRVRRDGVG
mmetsp:Transcript_9314/g.19665  ORF Transcript_9314/g.19665 Transcript_9314/m.19665 type:complete len:221 (-) Transcript_9314:399-1061(-)